MCRMSSFVVYLAISFAPRVASSTNGCPAGYGNKASAATSKCTGNAATCTTGLCCTLNSASCLAAGTVCGTGKYEDPSKYGSSSGTTSEQKIANCCSDVATCADVTCDAGYEKTHADPSSQKCANAVSSCSGCCKASTGKCANEANNICGSGKFKDSLKNGNDAGTTADAKKTNCCSDNPAQATCADVTCDAGYEKKHADPSSQKCQGGVSTCLGCCKASTGKCANEASNICGSGKFKDSLKNGNDAGTTADAKKTSCCTDSLTCTAWWALGAPPVASGALRGTPLSVAMIGGAATIVALM